MRRIRSGLGSAAYAGGEGGIRTHGTRKGTTVFETARFNRSRTSPWRKGTGLILSGAGRAGPVALHGGFAHAGARQQGFHAVQRFGSGEEQAGAGQQGGDAGDPQRHSEILLRTEQPSGRQRRHGAGNGREGVQEADGAARQVGRRRMLGDGPIVRIADSDGAHGNQQHRENGRAVGQNQQQQNAGGAGVAGGAEQHTHAKHRT